MKKAFNKLTLVVGGAAAAAILLLGLYVVFFSISERTGKSIAGTTKTFKGVVTGIACHGSTYDIRFTIAGQDRSFYINRGLEKGLDCDRLREKLIDKEVEISHVTFFNSFNSGHINQLCYNGEKVYSELN